MLVGALLAGTALAYHYSLLTIAARPWAAIACAGLAIALLPYRRRKEPDIHDRYTDYIVGVPLLVVALLLITVVPEHLTVTYWLWRIDLLSLPLFVAGATSLLFDVRILWRVRFSVIAVGLPWLLTVMRLSDGIALIGLAVVALIAVTSARVALAQRRPSAGHAIGRHRRPMVALMVVLVASATMAVGDGGLGEFAPLFDRAGLPAVSQGSPLPQITGWTSQHEATYGWVTRYLGSGARWDRYGYRPADPGTTPLVLDAISTASLTDLSSRDLKSFYRLHDARLLSTTSVQLHAGVVGHLVRYGEPARTSAWMALYWDWPVRASTGTHYQRIVVSAAGLEQTSSANLIRFADGLIDASARGASR